MSTEFACIADDVILGEHVYLGKFINLYGCTIGTNSKIGAFVEIQRGAKIGQNCKISSHSFICEGVVIEDGVFIGHGVMFINDKHPRATMPDGRLQNNQDWSVVPTIIRRGASIGTGSVIMCGIEIGANAMIGAGSVVTKSIPANATVCGNPARQILLKG
jgi:acetyltransferase-like isoleucine patch superfamily enzyme